MTDHPILFSAPMVLALIDGRKAMTRRILKPQPYIDHMGNFCAHDQKGKVWNYGQHLDGRPCVRNFAAEKVRVSVGDRLWVREGFSYEALDVDRNGFMPPWYWADGNPTSGDFTRPKPSIHMPRWASRLTLIVTDVRVERLQDISEEDALAEGVEYETADPPFYYVPGIWPHSLTAVGVEEGGGRHAARSFAKLWNHINGPNAWEANPWVSVTGFDVHRQNIDQMETA